MFSIVIEDLLLIPELTFHSNSGMGQYHGFEGFVEFSKLRPIFKQAAWPLGAAFLYPPYGQMFERIYDLLIKLRRL